jgi:hypothetical protein
VGIWTRSAAGGTNSAPNRPVGIRGSSSLFTFRHIFRDGGRMYIARFVVDDSAAVYGILRVVYADCLSC